MFRIGEFAQIAQVSSRQLRFYDQLGLLQPAHIDAQTGYRYYSIRQLPRLNGILALKELGLSLEQIGPLLKDEISPTELRAMLTLKRAEVERSLREEETRLRHIESRIAQIDRHGGTEGFDVILKSVEPTPFLSLHCSCADMDEVVRMVHLVAEDGARQIRPALRDKLVVVARNDHDDDKLDLEIGFSLTRPSNAGVRLTGDYLLRASELPAVETMATLVRPGTNMESHTSFGAVGTWIEANNYQIAGPCREVFLEPITGPPGFEGALVEIQFPITAGRLAFYVCLKPPIPERVRVPATRTAVPNSGRRSTSAGADDDYDPRRSTFRSYKKDDRHRDPEEGRPQVRSGDSGHARQPSCQLGHAQSDRTDPGHAGRRFYARRIRPPSASTSKRSGPRRRSCPRTSETMPARCGSTPMPAAPSSGIWCIRCSPRRSSDRTSAMSRLTRRR